MNAQSIRIILLGLAASIGAGASTIFGGSTTTVTGNTYTVSVTDFSTTGADMAGMILTAFFTSGQTRTCTWTTAGSCTSSGGEFNVTYPAANSTHPQVNNSNWTITNNFVGATMSSINFNGIAGLVAFDRCMTSAGVFNDTNPGGTTGTSCGTSGTTGSDIGFSVGSGTGTTGSAGTTGTVEYRDALHLASVSPVGDWWGQFTITFAGTAFTSGRTFTFRTDSDTLATAVLDAPPPTPTPEPSTFAMLGVALCAISLGARRRNR